MHQASWTDRIGRKSRFSRRVTTDPFIHQQLLTRKDRPLISHPVQSSTNDSLRRRSRQYLHQRAQVSLKISRRVPNNSLQRMTIDKVRFLARVSIELCLFFLQHLRRRPQNQEQSSALNRHEENGHRNEWTPITTATRTFWTIFSCCK